ncbi:hypothetical protein V5O48_018354 [Marasmius crinis-equi]|uniref:Myb/SANT-like domain-containing protein n=1 Tax=Marasmius crinis-equi TaxID=585013 RepID=A0ABR3ELE3_9AGAR
MAENIDPNMLFSQPPIPPASSQQAIKAKRTRSANRPTTLPAQFDWSGQNNEKTWLLIDHMERTENFKVLFGTKAGENSSGESKNSVYQRIAQAVWLEYCAEDFKGTWSRVAGKISTLHTEYKKEAKRLRVTGNGVQSVVADEVDPQDTQLAWYIPSGGPNEETPVEARNIWEAIEKKFPFFPRLHTFMSTRPNITPPVVTTGITPNGRETLYLQQPSARGTPTPISRTVSNSQIDPRILAESAAARANTQPATPAVSTPPSLPASTPATPTPTGRGQSSRVQDIIASVPKPPQKRTLEDVLMSVSEYVNPFQLLLCSATDQVARRSAQASLTNVEEERKSKRRRENNARRRLGMEEKAQVFQMVRHKMITPSRGYKMIKKIDRQTEKDVTGHSPLSSPSRSTGFSSPVITPAARSSSVEWDIEKDDNLNLDDGDEDDDDDEDD